MTRDQRKNLSVCQDAEKGGNGSPINSCNFQKHLACMLEFFLLCPTMEDKHPLLFHMQCNLGFPADWGIYKQKQVNFIVNIYFTGIQLANHTQRWCEFWQSNQDSFGVDKTMSWVYYLEFFSGVAGSLLGGRGVSGL